MDYFIYYFIWWFGYYYYLSGVVRRADIEIAIRGSSKGTWPILSYTMKIGKEMELPNLFPTFFRYQRNIDLLGHHIDQSSSHT